MLRITALFVTSLSLAFASASGIASLLELSGRSKMNIEVTGDMNIVVDPMSFILPGFLEEYTRRNESLVFDLESNCPTQVSVPNGPRRDRINMLRQFWTSDLKAMQTKKGSSPPQSSTSTSSQCRSQTPARYFSRIASYIYFALTSSSPALIIFFTLWLYFTGSLFFDVGHYTLHKFSKSQSKTLRRIGYLHEVHHLYFNRRLKFNDRYLWQNTVFELPLELGCQLIGTLLGYLAAKALNLTGPGLLSWELLMLVMDFEIVRSVVVAVMEGMDSNHLSYKDVVPKDPNTFVVGPEFHAMHHVDPSAYISSSFRVFDWAMGTACTLRRKRVAIAGVEVAFGDALKESLEVERVSCVERLGAGADATDMGVLVNTDILILGTFSEETVALIEMFKQHRKARPGSMLLPEVWYIASDSEVSMQSERDFEVSKGASKSFLRHARKYYDDPDFVYRHVITSSSPRDEKTESFKGTSVSDVRSALWWIKRGARYVPASHTGSAFLGYFKFRYSVEKAP